MVELDWAQLQHVGIFLLGLLGLVVVSHAMATRRPATSPPSADGDLKAQATSISWGTAFLIAFVIMLVVVAVGAWILGHRGASVGYGVGGTGVIALKAIFSTSRGVLGESRKDKGANGR